MKKAFLILSIFFTAVLLSSCGGSRKIQITIDELNDGVRRVLLEYSSQGLDISEEEKSQLKADLLDQLIERKLFVAEAARRGMKVAEDELNAEFESEKSQFSDEQKFLDAIGKYGYTRESLREEMRKSILMQKFLDRITNSIEVSVDELRDVYEENPQYFETPESVSASHILISLDADADDRTRADAMSRIQDVAAKIKAGEDFAQLAIEYSEGPSAPSGGDLGYFSKKQMIPEFDEAAFALEPGEISNIVETQHGFHIIKLNDRKKPETMAFEEAQDYIKNLLLRQKKQQAILDTVEKLKKKYRVEAPEL